MGEPTIFLTLGLLPRKVGEPVGPEGFSFRTVHGVLTLNNSSHAFLEENV